MPNYCESLKKERLVRGLTQEEMASLLGLKRSTYSLYESGKRVISDSALQRIAAMLNISYYELSENDSVESLLHAQESLSHSLQRDLEVIVYEISKLEKNIYSKGDESEKESLKDELDEKQKEKDYICRKLKSIEYDIAELRKYLYKIQELQKKQLTTQNPTEKDELCRKIVELKDNARNVIKKRTTNHVQINTSIKIEDVDWKLNEIIQKARRKEELTQEEQQQFTTYLQTFNERWEFAKERMNGHLKRLQAVFEQLNESGQEKADEQIDRLIEQLELLTKIPEYQKDYETKTAAPERELQDGETDTQ